MKKKPEFLTNLQREATENPVIALGVGAAVATAAAKLIDSASAVTGRRAYAKQVKLSAKRQNASK